jgi:methionyl-tRNA synthetase
MDRIDVSGALDEIWSMVRRLNQYVQEEEPWQLAKDEAQAERLDQVLAGAIEGLRVTSLLLLPFIPEKAATLLTALGESSRSLDAATFGTGGARQVTKIDPLFPRVEA